jgi:hypothetical protein
MLREMAGDVLTTCEPGGPDSRRCTFMGDMSCTDTPSTVRSEVDTNESKMHNRVVSQRSTNVLHQRDQIGHLLLAHPLPTPCC